MQLKSAEITDPADNSGKQTIFTKLFCVCVQKASNQVEWTIIDTLNQTADYTSIVPPEGNLLDSTVKLIKAITENNTSDTRSCIVSIPQQMETIATELKQNARQIPPCITTYSDLFAEHRQWEETNGKTLLDKPKTLGELHDRLGIKNEEYVEETLENIANATTRLLKNGHVFQGKDKCTFKENVVVVVGVGKREHKRMEPNSPIPFGELKKVGEELGSERETRANGPSSSSLSNVHKNYQQPREDRDPRDPRDSRDSIEREPGRGRNVVRLRGLPWQITEEDIIEFFRGLVIIPNGIFFIRDSHGRPSGDGFVRLESKHDFEEAIKRHKHFIGRRYIEVFSSSMEEWYNAGASSIQTSDRNIHVGGKPSIRASTGTSVTGPSGPSYDQNRSSGDQSGYFRNSRNIAVGAGTSNFGFVVRMRGLPYSVTIEDVIDFFRGFGVRENQVYILMAQAGGITGDGYVQFSTNHDAEKAMDLHNSRIGSRYIELFKSDPLELKSVLSRSTWMRPSPRDYPSRSRDYDRDLSHRYVPYTREPMDRMRNSYPPPTRDYDLYRAPPPPSISRHSPNQQTQAGGFALRLRGLPYSVTNRDIEIFFEGAAICRDGIHLVRNRQGKLTGEAYVEFRSEDDKRIALRKQNNRIGSRYIELFHVSDEEFSRFYPRAPSREYEDQMSGRYPPAPVDPALVRMLQTAAPGMGPPPRSYSTYPDPYRSQGPPPPPSTYGYHSGDALGAYPPGGYNTGGFAEPSVVIRGLSAHVTVADIQEYFSGYNFIRDSIQVVSNVQRTVFEATVQFASVSEARRALKEKECGRVGTSYVKLYER